MARSEPGYDRIILTLFFIFSLYMVLPIADVPLMGLSLSAPIFFVIAMICVLKPPFRWFAAYRGWIVLATQIWLGIFISAILNGLLSGGANISNNGILTIIRYAYWLLAFVITAYFVSQGKVLQTVTNLLGWGVMVLALLRWGEVLIFHNIGAWTGTHLLSENDYGFQFSVYSPFLLLLMLQQRGGKRALAFVGYILLCGAAAINGSRGSWVSMGVGLALCLVILAWSRSRKFIGLLGMLMLVTGLLGAAWITLPQVSAKVLPRINTLKALNDDKSYMVRQVMIQKGVYLFEHSPILGVGAGRFNDSYVPLDVLNIPVVLRFYDQSYFDNATAHNSYVDFLAEGGLISVIPFAGLVVLLVILGLSSAYRGARMGQYLALAVFLAFIQMSIHMWVNASLTNTSNWFIYGLVVAAFIVTKNKIQAKQDPTERMNQGKS
jgi:O-antigen ligase